MLLGVLVGVTLITFAIARVVPGDPAHLIAGTRASPEIIAEIRQNLGLDQPLYQQYISYMSDLFQGDLGTSIVTNRPVLEELTSYFPATIELMLFALCIAIVVGITLGVLSAVYKDSILDHVVRVVAIAGISTPSFWLALVLLLFFYGYLGVLPGPGRIDGMIDAPTDITGLYLIDSLLIGNYEAFRSAFSHIILPALTLAIVSIGGFVRIIRSSMLDVLSEDYIRTARATGLSNRTIVFNHALRNALIPFITVLAVDIASLLFGSVIVETIYSWPGAGSYVLNAIFALDFPVIMGFTVIVSIVYVLVNLAVDIAYSIVDPQIREVN